MAAAKVAAHGTRARYRAKCGCVKCKKWKADDTAAYRARKAERDGVAPAKRAPKRARPTPEFRPTESEPETPPATVRRPSSDDALAQLIEQALWDARGDEGTASVLAAAAIRDAGYRLEVDGPIETAFRAGIPESADPMVTALREVVLRQARGLDDPGNVRNSKQLWEVARQALADMNAGGGADDAAKVMAALWGPDGSGDGSEVGDSA